MRQYKRGVAAETGEGDDVAPKPEVKAEPAPAAPAEGGAPEAETPPET